MKQAPSPGWQLLRYLAYLIGATLLCAGLLSAVLAHAIEDPSTQVAWAAPSAMAVRRVSDIPDGQHELNFLGNLDCSTLTYRLSAGSSLQNGCFTETAFGWLDSDNDTVIFNGTDEGLPFLPYSAHDVLVPWPQSGALLALDAASTGGSYISLYKNPLASLQNQRNTLLQLTGKQVTKPADLSLTDGSGKQLVVNAQTLAFSDNGSWLVVETLSGSFVRINLATLDVTAFAPAFGSQGSPALLKSQVAVSSDGRYVAIANTDAGSLKVYDLAACGSVTAGSQPQNCPAYDYQPFVARQVAGFQAIRHLRFINDGLLSFEAQASDPASSGVYELAPSDKIQSLIDYLGLGDSYSSGEGAFDYLAGTDTADDMCHLSVHSYPLLLTHDLFGTAGGHSVACSGAEINDVGSASPGYRGQVRGVVDLEQLQTTQSALLNSIMTDYSPGYVAQQRFVQQYQPAVTTVSVGGNDIGFGDILQKCVAPHIGLHPSNNTCYNSYEDRLEVTNLIDRTVPRWTALYEKIVSEAPGTQLYVIGYPQIADDKGNCALNVHLNASELAFSEELIDYLNTTIKQAAVAAGARYVDISQALAGHRLCEAASYDVAVNGLTAGSDAGPFGLKIFGRESYHPNALGQALMEQAILHQTNNLTALTPSVAGSGAQNILDAPKTGRPINTLVPDDSLTSGVAQAGHSLSLQANGVRDGLTPNTAYTIRLDGAGGLAVGSATSDENGDISTSLPLPDNTAPGGHTIDVTGNNQAGEPVDITQPIYIPASDNDADGDGIPDNLDTCPGAVNSGQDSDGDGIDDVCDASIGLPPSGGQAGPNGSAPITDSRVTGMIVSGDQPLSVAATFTPDIGQAALVMLGSTLVQAVEHNGQIERLVDSSTVRPGAVPAQNLRLPADKPPAGLPRPFAGLYVIDWLVWLALILITWLLITAGWCAKRSADNVRRRVGTQIGRIRLQ